MQQGWYRFFRGLIRIGMWFRFRIVVIGRENVPQNGRVLIAPNHQAFIDSLVIPISLNRIIMFLAKDQYFTRKGLLGKLSKWFFTIAAVPVDRDDKKSGQRAIESGMSFLMHEQAFLIYPEGTRAIDTKVYRGNRGIIKLAWETKTPIIPTAITGTARHGGFSLFPLRRTITVIYGEPIHFERPHTALLPFQANKAQVDQTRKLMETIASLAGWQYVHEDSRMLKQEIERTENQIKQLKQKKSSLKSRQRHTSEL